MPAGTPVSKLSSTHFADATAMTSGPGNTGFSSASTGSGNTAQHLDAAKMGGSEGFRITQAGGVQSTWFLDLPAAVDKLGLIIAFTLGALPTGTLTICRGYSDVAHSVTTFGVNITTAGKVQIVEGSSTVVGTSTASLVAGTPYLMQPLIEGDSKTFTFNFYAVGTMTLAATVSGTFAATQQNISLRWGPVGPLNSTLDTNDWFSAGSGGYLERPDVLQARISVVGASGGAAGSTVVVNRNDVVTATLSSINGTATTYTVDWGDGTAVSTGASTSRTHPYATAGTYTVTVTPGS